LRIFDDTRKIYVLAEKGRGWRSRVRVKGKNICTSAEMWTGLQADYDLRLARQEKARVIERDVAPLAALQLSMA